MKTIREIGQLLRYSLNTARANNALIRRGETSHCVLGHLRQVCSLRDYSLLDVSEMALGLTEHETWCIISGWDRHRFVAQMDGAENTKRGKALIRLARTLSKEYAQN